MVTVERLLGDVWHQRNSIAHALYHASVLRRHLQRIGHCGESGVQHCLLSAELRGQHVDDMGHVLAAMWRRHLDALTHDSARDVRRHVLDDAGL